MKGKKVTNSYTLLNEADECTSRKQACPLSDFLNKHKGCMEKKSEVQSGRKSN